ncbi:MAG: hypothetical protein WBA07_19445, partial [Rivularia sp. (in: cyanobacteria)]
IIGLPVFVQKWERVIAITFYISIHQVTFKSSFYGLMHSSSLVKNFSITKVVFLFLNTEFLFIMGIE